MLKIGYRYVYEDVDRHGNVRVYVWRGKGHRKIRLKSRLHSPNFDTEYRTALAASTAPRTKVCNDPTKLPVPGTYRHLCTAYMASVEFARLSPCTQRVRRGILQSTFDETIHPQDAMVFADVPIGELTVQAVRVLRDRKAKTPEAANGRLKAIRQVFTWAIDAQRPDVTYNPARDVPYLKGNGKGWHSWTVEEIEQFEARHPVGTKARLALALCMFTGQRRSDIVRLGRQHARDGWLHFTQAKNEARKPISIDIPILDVLQEIIDQSPVGDLTFLVTQFGRPFTTNGFGNWFRRRCNEAGLPHCSAHGLRKASAASAAENGASEDQLMAIFGWLTPKQAAHYTKGARRRKLAGAGMKALERDRG